MSGSRIPVYVRLIALVSLASLALVGCTTLGVSGLKDLTKTGELSANLKNDLRSGSAVHKLIAGDAKLTVTYWSTLRMDKWKAGISKPLTFSIAGVAAHGSKRNVFLKQASMDTVVYGPFGTIESPQLRSDTSSVKPGYLITRPYSYSQVFQIPPIDKTATSVTLSFAFEVLIETGVGTGKYVKQTTNDQITVAITQ